jgi:hypothetical protein
MSEHLGLPYEQGQDGFAVGGVALPALLAQRAKRLARL